MYVLNVCDTRVQWVSQWVKQAGRTPASLLLELRLLLLPGRGPRGPRHRHVDSCSHPPSLWSLLLPISLCDLSSFWPGRHRPFHSATLARFIEGAKTSSFRKMEEEKEEEERERRRSSKRDHTIDYTRASRSNPKIWVLSHSYVIYLISHFLYARQQKSYKTHLYLLFSIKTLMNHLRIFTSNCTFNECPTDDPSRPEIVNPTHLIL